MTESNENREARPRILFVDDSRLIRFAAGRMLKSKFDVVQAEDGEAACRALAQDPSIRAVITDINMPRLDGIGLIRRIRGARDAAFRSLPILVVTSVEEAIARRRAMEAGANDLVPKPFTAHDMIDPIESYLGLAKRAPIAGAEPERKAAAPTDLRAEPVDPAPIQSHELRNVERRRFSLISRAEQAMRLHHRHSIPLSLIHIRLRNHKRIASQHGRACAEATMRHVERNLARLVRVEDTVGRLQPDVFSVLMLATPEAGARILCERLARALSRMPARFPTHTVSPDLAFAVQTPMGEADGETLLEAGLARLETTNVVPFVERATA